METECFWLRILRELSDVVQVIVVGASLNGPVKTGAGELEGVREHFGLDVAFNNVAHQTSVNVVSDTASVVNLSEYEIEHFVGNQLLSVKENLQLFLANVEVLC